MNKKYIAILAILPFGFLPAQSTLNQSLTACYALALPDRKSNLKSSIKRLGALKSVINLSKYEQKETK